MEKVESFDFVLDYLKNKIILTTNGKNKFVYRKNRILCVQDGTSYSMSLDDFKEVYGKYTFYVFEDNSAEIDLTKDEAYYRYYKK